MDALTTITVGGLANDSGASIMLDGSASYAAALTIAGQADNAGIITLGSYSVLNVTGGHAFTQSGGTITVDGTFAATIINIDGGTLIFNTTNFTNTGTLAAADGGVINFSAGGLTNLSGTTLTGGTYIVDANSTLQLPNNAFVETLAADLTLSGTGSVVQSLDTAADPSVPVPLERTLSTIAGDGTLNIQDGRSYTTANTITDAGTLQISGGHLHRGGAKRRQRSRGLRWR